LGILIRSAQAELFVGVWMVRAIVVEDNYEFRESFKKILSHRYPFIEVAEAENAEEAMRGIDLSPPDLIFMDIHLPGKSGLQLTQEIKARYPNTVIIVLSNNDLTEYRESAYRSGADYFVAKDSSLGDFFSLIEWITQNGIKS